MSVTIVVPAHNAGSFIVETLRTILANLSVLDVIVVDDGSSDATVELVRGVAKHEPRVSLIRCDANRGAGVARNIGFAAARGDFTMFLDADDFLVPGAVDELHAAMSRSSADVGVFRYQYCRQGPHDASGTHGGELKFWESLQTAKLVDQTGFDQIPGILTTPNFPWNKIARTSYLRAIALRFSETFIFNDILGHWMIYLNARDILLYNKCLIFHRVDQSGPVQLSTQSNRRCLDVFIAFEDVELLIDSNASHLKYYRYFLYLKLEILAFLVFRLPHELFAEFHAAIASSYRRLDTERLASVASGAPDIARLSLQAKTNPAELFPPPAPAHLLAPVAPEPAMPAPPFRSAPYWEQRYRTGGTSGAGSRGRLAAFKANVINTLVERRSIESMIELGCGDGDQLAQFNVAHYVGVDVSDTVVMRCREAFAGSPGRFFYTDDDPRSLKTADMAVSLDVIYHLTEDETFERYMNRLFCFGRRNVVIYSSSVEAAWPDRHVRHRNVLAHVETFFPDWILEEHVPNIYPYDPKEPDTTSFSDFFIFTNTWSTAPHTGTSVSSQPRIN